MTGTCAFVALPSPCDFAPRVRIRTDSSNSLLHLQSLRSQIFLTLFDDLPSPDTLRLSSYLRRKGSTKSTREMARVPVIGRLYSREYFAVIFGFLFIVFEGLLRFVIFFIPRPIIMWFRDRTRQIFNRYFVPRDHSSKAFISNDEQRIADKIRVALDFEELCEIFGYQHEEHVVQTKDGYLLGLHRIPCRKGERNEVYGMSSGRKAHKPVVYLHHGLLMCSDVFLCTTTADRSLPLMLAEAGYDVWLGNNRGNKYSKKHTSYHPYTSKFW